MSWYTPTAQSVKPVSEMGGVDFQSIQLAAILFFHQPPFSLCVSSPEKYEKNKIKFVNGVTVYTHNPHATYYNV